MLKLKNYKDPNFIVHPDTFYIVVSDYMSFPCSIMPFGANKNNKNNVNESNGEASHKTTVEAPLECSFSFELHAHRFACHHER